MQNLITVFSERLGFIIIWAISEVSSYHATSNGDLTSCSLLAVYDLGASAGLLQKIYADEAISQRPIILEPKDESIVVSKDNWIQYLENQRYVE